MEFADRHFFVEGSRAEGPFNCIPIHEGEGCFLCVGESLVDFPCVYDAAMVNVFEDGVFGRRCDNALGGDESPSVGGRE